MRVHLFGPGSIQKISEPQGKKTVSGELQSKAETLSALLFFLCRTLQFLRILLLKAFHIPGFWA
jgi:hypothetical protein